MIWRCENETAAKEKTLYFSDCVFYSGIVVFFFPTGISAQEPAVKIWPFPEDLPEQYKSSDFSISAEGLEVPVYASGLNAWGNTVSYASFESTREITVCVTVHFPLETAVILPRSLGKQRRFRGTRCFYGFTRRGYHAAAGWGLQWTGTTFVCACPIGECAGQSISRGVVLRTRLS